MPEPLQDPYATLGLPRDATAAQIKQGYFALVRAHPPEREPELFKRIRAAYERLRDPEQRSEADLPLLQPWPASPRKRRPPAAELALHPADVIAVARALSDLERSDWREQFGKVTL